MSAQREPEWSLPDSFELADRARRERSRILEEMIAGLWGHVGQLTTAARDAIRRSPAPAVLPNSDAPIA